MLFVHTERQIKYFYMSFISCDTVADPCSLLFKKTLCVPQKHLFQLCCFTIPCLCFPFCHFSIILGLFFGWAGSVTEASPFLLDSYISLFPLLPLRSVQTEVKAWGNQTWHHDMLTTEHKLHETHFEQRNTKMLCHLCLFLRQGNCVMEMKPYIDSITVHARKRVALVS